MERHILVTGGCGFLGSHFINKHFILNPESFIVNLDALYHTHTKEENINLFVSQSSRYIFIEGNCCDFDLVLHILKTYEIDIIVHFAAQSHVQNYLTDTGKYVKDNIVGTQTLLEATRKYGQLEKFIHVSTDEVSGDFLMSPYDLDNKTEQSVYCATNPYAASKASAELLVSSYFHTFKLPIIITRGNSVYGPKQNPQKMIPKFIKALQEGEKINIHGDGSRVRGFLHVYDATTAIDLILDKGIIGEIYNIGCESDDECSVLDIAKGLILLMINNNLKTEEEFSQYLEFDETCHKMKDKRYFVSNYKLKKLGWKLEIPFIDGLLGLIQD